MQNILKGAIKKKSLRTFIDTWKDSILQQHFCKDSIQNKTLYVVHIINILLN